MVFFLAKRCSHNSHLYGRLCSSVAEERYKKCSNIANKDRFVDLTHLRERLYGFQCHISSWISCHIYCTSKVYPRHPILWFWIKYLEKTALKIHTLNTNLFLLTSSTTSSFLCTLSVYPHWLRFYFLLLLLLLHSTRHHILPKPVPPLSPSWFHSKFLFQWDAATKQLILTFMDNII